MILTEKEIDATLKRAEAAWLAEKQLLDFDVIAARAIESALLEKLRGGVELPEPAGYYEQEYIGEPSRIEARFDHDQLLQYGDARALAARERGSAIPVVEQLVEALCELVQSDGLPRTLEQLDASVKKAFAAIAAGQTFIKESKHA